MSKVSEKLKALAQAVLAIEKQFGKGSIMKLGEEGEAPPVPVIPSGSIGLDLALGVGGYPRGRVIEIFGPESSGKTTLALHAIAEAQKAGGVAAFIDAEHALDVGYARKLGVNIGELLISQPDTGEQALEIAEQLVRSGACDILVVDSVAALVPKAEIEGDMGDPHMGLQARLMSQAMRKLTSVVSAQPLHGGLHQPDPHEDRRGLRQPRDHHRRPGPQVLLVGAARHPAHRAAEGGRAGGGQPHPGEGGEEQGRAALSRGRVRRPLRGGRGPAGGGPRPRRGAGHRGEVGRPLLARRRAHRAGQGAGQRVAAGAPGRARVAGGPDQRRRRRHRSPWRPRPSGARAPSLRAERPVLPAEREVEAARRGRVLGEAHPERDLRRAGEAGVVARGERGAEQAVPRPPAGSRGGAAPGRRPPAPASSPAPAPSSETATTTKGVPATATGALSLPIRTCQPPSGPGARPRQSTSRVRSWVTGSPFTRKRPSSSMERPAWSPRCTRRGT